MANDSQRIINRFGGNAWKGASWAVNSMRAFIAPLGSADYDLTCNRETLLLRARALFQNHAFSRAIISSLSTNVVGTGVKVRPQLKQLDVLGLTHDQAVAWCRKTQDLYEIWSQSKKCDVERKNDMFGLQDLALKTQLIDGDCFALAKYDKKIEPFGLCLKLLEADRCMNPLGMIDTDRLTQGVEVNDFGTPLNYYFTKRPAWSIDNYSDLLETVRVPAFDRYGEANVLHIFSPDRTDQRRGVSILAPIIVLMKQQERFLESELMAAVVTSMLTAFIESNDEKVDDPFLSNVPEDERVAQPSEAASADAPLELTSGGIIQLKKGQKVSAVNPTRPNSAYQGFVEAIFSEAASSLGLSYEVVLRKFNSSYNAVRGAILESKKTFDRARRNLISDFCRPVYEKWLSQAILTGVIDAPGYFEDPIKRALWNGCRWIADSAFLLDPLKETQAYKMQLDEQLITRDTACAAINGGEYESVLDGQAEEKKMRKAKKMNEPGLINKSETFSVSTDDVNESAL
jgi:lambda family phage portal protein